MLQRAVSTTQAGQASLLAHATETQSSSSVYLAALPRLPMVAISLLRWLSELSATPRRSRTSEASCCGMPTWRPRTLNVGSPTMTISPAYSLAEVAERLTARQKLFLRLQYLAAPLPPCPAVLRFHRLHRLVAQPLLYPGTRPALRLTAQPLRHPVTPLSQLL
jgi:hypothetical protein